MLPIALSKSKDLEAIAAEARAGQEIEVDPPNQTISDAHGKKICGFEVEEFRKHCLVNGLDDIGLAMQMEDKIRQFEAKISRVTPWLDGSRYLTRKGMDGPIEAKPVKVPTTNRGQELHEPLDW